MADIDLFFKNDKTKEVLHFPVNPINDIKLKLGRRYDKAEIVNIGEVDVFKEGENIEEIAIKTFLPEKYEDYCRHNKITKPKEIVEKLKLWTNQKECIRLILTDFPLNTLACISNLQIGQESGLESDREIEMTLRINQKELKVRKVEKNKTIKIPLNTNRPNTKTNEKTYIVKKRDTLWSIAKKVLGKGSRWPEIYNIPQNKKTIGKNPNIIKQGQKLILPKSR